MKPQEAIRILMLSPWYWKLGPRDRRRLIREFCAAFSRLADEQPASQSRALLQGPSR